MVLHVLGGIIKVCHTGLLLADVLAFHHTAAYSDTVRLLGMLDHR